MIYHSKLNKETKEKDIKLEDKDLIPKAIKMKKNLDKKYEGREVKRVGTLGFIISKKK